MADITLKAYLAHLDDLLGRRLYDEAEAHCKHILAKYPKNLQTLRRLAKAQFEGGHYPEAEVTYSTVLSMEPRGVDAYVGLSWIARQRNQGDQTIALLERAFEQESSNQDVIQLLRDANRTFYDRTNAKLPQTQFIAARQQWRSGLGQQAVATLNSALAADPARADIRLLKMQIHQQMGDGVEAARAATDVLKQLPDCVEANRMLAEFWKAQGRSSDAQRFVNRVESSDPFLAFEIATGAPPPEDALMLTLYSFRGAPSNATAADAPAWLGELDKAEPTQRAMPKVEAAPQMDWLEQADPILDDSEKVEKKWVTDAIDSFNSAEDLSWLTDVASDDASSEKDDAFDFGADLVPSAEADKMPAMDMDWMDDAAATDEGDTLPSVSTRMAEEEVKNAEVLGELAALSGDSKLESAPVAAEAPAGQPVEAAGAWMDELEDASSDPTNPDREEFDDFLKNFTSFSELSAEPSAQSSGTGLTGLLSGLASSDEAEPAYEAPNPDAADIDPEDPLAWMRAGISDDVSVRDTQEQDMPDLDALLSNDAFSGDSPVVESAEAAAGEIEPTSHGDEDDPFAWMQKHDDIEMADDTPVHSLWDDPMGVEQMGSLDESDVDPLDWMNRAGLDVDRDTDLDAEPENDPLAWAKESGLDLLEDVGAANFTATAALSSDMAFLGEAESAKPSPFDDIPTNQPPQTPKSGLLAYMKDDSADQGEDSPMSDQQLPDWLKGPDDKDETPKADAGDSAEFDWMAVTPSEPEAEIDWDAVPESEAVDEPAPDWLASLDNPVDVTEAAALSAKDNPAISDLWDDAADDVTADTPDWMAALRDDPAAVDEPVSEAAEWVFSKGEAAKDEIEGTADDMLATASAAEDSLDWLSAAAPGEAVSETTAEADDAADHALDWLNAAAPTEAAGEAVEEADDALGWLSSAAPAEAMSDAADTVEAEDTLDWLRAAPEAAASEAEDSLDWLSAEPPNEVVAAPAATSMDWLDMSGDEEADGVGDQTNAFVAKDTLDWLTADAGLPADAEDDSAERAVSPEFMGANADDTLDFGGDFDFNAPELSDEELAGGDADFLGELAAAGISGSGQESDLEAPSFELSFLEDEGPTEDVATVELEGDPLPDWLMEVRSDVSAVRMDVDVPEGQLDVQGELSGEILDDADLLEAEPPMQESLNASAVNSPDWLNAMVPGLEIGTDVAEDAEEPVAEAEFLNGGRSDFSWLTSMVDEELAPPAQAAPSRRSARFPFSEPPSWLANLREETQASAPVLDFDADDDSLPDWLKFDDAETN